MNPLFKVKARYIDKKERQRRLEAVAKLASNSYAVVGIKDPATKYPDPTQDVTVGEVAAWMEFGTNRVPARSFLRTPIDTMGEGFSGVQTRNLGRILQGQISIADGLAALGFYVKNVCQNAIYRGIDPPLAEATRRNKRTVRKAQNKPVSSTPDTPLMDTHQLVQSINYEVYLGETSGAD